MGLKNFQQLIRDTQFIRSMQNMILLVVVVTLITFAFALVFAAILTREKIKGQNFFRVVFYIPNILSVVVISGIFSAIYKPENGMLNSIIGLFHDMTNPILWKGEKLVIPSIIIAMVWQAVGYYMVMYMASMSSVPASLYESANLDGASRLTQFFRITIPLIWTNIRTTLTFFIISTINMAFLFVTAMTSGGPNHASEVALSYMYSQKNAGLLRLQHGHRRGDLRVLLRAVRLHQQGHQPRAAGILKEGTLYAENTGTNVLPLGGKAV